MSAPHADRDRSECWELEDGDTGEPLLVKSAVIEEVKAWANAAVDSEPSARAAATTAREVELARGLPEYVTDLKWQLAYWEWLAKYGRRKRFWRSGWDRWGLKWFAGGDEFGRHTVVVGPWVIALWSCRCDDCKADEQALLAVIDSDEEES